MRGLSAFSGCGWAYGFTLTLLPPQSLPQVGESWLKSYLMQVCKPCHYISTNTVEPFKLHPMSMSYIYKVFEHLLRCYGFTLTPLPPQTFPQIWECWMKSYLMQVCKPCHNSLVKAVEPFKLHPLLMANMYKKIEHFFRLWMGIWHHIHIIITIETSPDL
jgi:hypothetical protein